MPKHVQQATHQATAKTCPTLNMNHDPDRLRKSQRKKPRLLVCWLSLNCQQRTAKNYRWCQIPEPKTLCLTILTALTEASTKTTRGNFGCSIWAEKLQSLIPANSVGGTCLQRAARPPSTQPVYPSHWKIGYTTFVDLCIHADMS